MGRMMNRVKAVFGVFCCCCCFVFYRESGVCEWVHTVTRTGNDGDEEPALWENDIIKIKMCS